MHSRHLPIFPLVVHYKVGWFYTQRCWKTPITSISKLNVTVYDSAVNRYLIFEKSPGKEVFLFKAELTAQSNAAQPQDRDAMQPLVPVTQLEFGPGVSSLCTHNVNVRKSEGGGKGQSWCISKPETKEPNSCLCVAAGGEACNMLFLPSTCWYGDIRVQCLNTNQAATFYAFCKQRGLKKNVFLLCGGKKGLFREPWTPLCINVFKMYFRVVAPRVGVTLGHETLSGEVWEDLQESD